MSCDGGKHELCRSDVALLVIIEHRQSLRLSRIVCTKWPKTSLGLRRFSLENANRKRRLDYTLWFDYPARFSVPVSDRVPDADAFSTAYCVRGAFGKANLERARWVDSPIRLPSFRPAEKMRPQMQSRSSALCSRLDPHPCLCIVCWKERDQDVQSRSALAYALRNLLLMKERVVEADAFLVSPAEIFPILVPGVCICTSRYQIVHSGFTLPYDVLCFRPVEDQVTIPIFSAVEIFPTYVRGVCILNANITLVTCPMQLPFRRAYERAGRRCSRMFVSSAAHILSPLSVVSSSKRIRNLLYESG